MGHGGSLNRFEGVSITPPPAHVADLAARLSLTGIAPGYQVIQDDNLTTYEYNGPSTESVAGLTVTDGGTPGDAGIYKVDTPDTHNSYVRVDSGEHVSWESDHWQAASGYRTTPPADEAFPWNAVFDDLHGSEPPAPTISRNNIASEANWSVVL